MVAFKDTNRLIPAIRPFVERLFTSGLFHKADVDIVNPLSGLSSSESHDSSYELCDRFKLVLPFAGHSVTWEVIFDGTCPDIAPDFIFDDDSFMYDFDVESIPSLLNWNASNDMSLVLVLSELLKLFTKYQLQRISRNCVPIVEQWLDIKNVIQEGVKVEVLNGCQRTNTYMTPPRQQNTLQNGMTIVVITICLTCEDLPNADLAFSLEFLFKSSSNMYEEKLICSPELEMWIQPLWDNSVKKCKWVSNSKSLSDEVQTHVQDLQKLLSKAVKDLKERECLQLYLQHSIMSKDELNPSLLEFDYNDFLYSSYCFSGRKIFSVDYQNGHARGRLFLVNEDCSSKKLKEIVLEKLTDPSADIIEMITADEA